MHSNSNFNDRQDSLQRRQMEAERATLCLEWFQEFKQEIQAQIWEDLRKGREEDCRAMVLCIEKFESLLVRKANDGIYAKEELKEDGR